MRKKEERKKKRFRWLFIPLIVLAVLITAVAVWIGIYELKISITKGKIQRLAEEYAATQYPDYQISRSFFDHKWDQYIYDLEKPGAIDETFQLYYNEQGDLVQDSYEVNVAQRNNLQGRILREYGQLMNDPLQEICPEKEGQFPGVSLSVYLDDETVSYLQEHGKNLRLYPNQLVLEDLPLNEDLDLYAIGSQYGIVHFSFVEDQVDLDTLYNKVTEVGNFLKERNLPFKYLELRIQTPFDQERKAMYVNGIDADLINSPDLYGFLQENAVWD